MILLNDFRRQWADTGADVLAAVERAGGSGWYILGDEVRGFERKLARFWGLPHAVGVASGLDAIELSLRAAGCQPGDRVLTSPISAFATVLAIVKAGAVPVFADADASGLADLAGCRRILAQDSSIRFFVPVHLYGHAMDLDALRALRDDFELTIVEDCAQSIGAAWNGRATGSIGRFAATSFYPTKNLGALGDGGAVLADGAVDADQIRKLRDYGQGAKYRHDIIGYNSRLDELQAAILASAFLPRLERWTEARRSISTRYRAGISNPALAVPPAPPGSQSCGHLFPVLVSAGRKTEAMAHFKARGVAVAEHYPLPLIDQPALGPMRAQIGGDTPRAREFCAREISLPIHPYLTETEVDRVIEACNAFR